MDVKEFKDIIENIVDVEMNKQGITKFIAAKVASVNEDGTINVYLPPDNTDIITGLLNKTGRSLFQGDSVELCAKNGKIKNAWVAIKHGENFVVDGGSSNNELMPIGTITPYGGDIAYIPENWLLCDGRAVSRITYSALFGVIGTSFGLGDGSTTFNLPNLKGKIPVGRDTTDSAFDTLGETGGEKEHILTVNEMPSHNHTLDGGNGLTDADYFLKSGSAYANAPSITKGGDWYGNGYVNIASAGGDQSHNNLQPYQVTYYIIKAFDQQNTSVHSEVLPVGSEILYEGDVADIPDGWVLVNESVSYSTTEQNTGLTWIDGKPLYQRTFYGDLTLGSITEVADLSSLNYEHVSFYDVSFTKTNSASGSGKFWFPVFYDSSTDYARVYLRDRDKKLLGLVRGDAVSELKVYITLRYTKTTDSV